MAINGVIVTELDLSSGSELLVGSGHKHQTSEAIPRVRTANWAAATADGSISQIDSHNLGLQIDMGDY